jgi:hypothetical protein
MATNETKRRLAVGGMFFLPLVLVKATAMFLGGTGPVEVSAAPAAAAPAPVEPIITLHRAWTERERAAAQHIAQLHDEPFGATPLYYEPRGGEAVVVFEDPEILSAPEFIVQAVLSSSAGNTALIDGRPLRVGDALGETGWQITEIDAEARSVTIWDPHTDRTATRSVQGLP